MAKVTQQTEDQDERRGYGRFDQKAQNEAQKKHAEMVQKRLDEKDQIDTSLLVDTKQTTKEHIGKISAEEHLDDDIAARKVGMLIKKSGVKKIQQMHDGEAVDVIQVPEDDDEYTVPGATPLNEGQRVQAAIDEHRGGKKKAKSEDSGVSKEDLESSQAKKPGHIYGNKK